MVESSIAPGRDELARWAMMKNPILEVPRYSGAEAARLIGVSSSRARRWWKGYVFAYQLANGSAKAGRSPPVGRNRATPEMSFLDLMDLLLVKRLRDHGVSLQFIRLLFQELLSTTSETHLAAHRFFVQSARAVFWDHEPSAPLLTQLGAGGQTALRGAVVGMSDEIDVEQESLLPLRWYPAKTERQIVLDPAVMFGQPHIVGHRLTTDVVYDLYLAENGNSSAVAGWFCIPQEKVDAAVGYHTTLVA